MVCIAISRPFAAYDRDVCGEYDEYAYYFQDGECLVKDEPVSNESEHEADIADERDEAWPFILDRHNKHSSR